MIFFSIAKYTILGLGFYFLMCLICVGIGRLAKWKFNTYLSGATSEELCNEKFKWIYTDIYNNVLTLHMKKRIDGLQIAEILGSQTIGDNFIQDGYNTNIDGIEYINIKTHSIDFTIAEMYKGPDDVNKIKRKVEYLLDLVEDITITMEGVS